MDAHTISFRLYYVGEADVRPGPLRIERATVPGAGSPAMPRLARIARYPIKSLDAQSRETARIVDGGGLAGDREFAVVDGDGEYVNGKRTPDVHRLRAAYADDLSWVRLRRDEGATDPTDGARRFGLRDADDHAELAEFLAAHFGYPVSVRREPDGGMPDDTADSGPTVISTATVETVAGWFDGVDPDGVRARFRANLEVGGVDPFWEDRLYAADGPVAFRVGDVRFVGAGPCNRCVVPTRDPRTGEVTEGFRERFLERRGATLPEWAPDERFDHFYKLMVNTRVPGDQQGASIAVGDEVDVLESVD